RWCFGGAGTVGRNRDLHPRRSQSIIRARAAGPESLFGVAMARCVLVRWSFGALIAGLVSACSGGKSASTAPAPATSREGTPPTAAPAKPAVRGLTYPASEGYMLALSRETRTRTGQPGPHYWQQWADYSLQAELNPVSKRMTGKGTIKYF